MRLVIHFHMLLNPSFKIITSFANEEPTLKREA